MLWMVTVALAAEVDRVPEDFATIQEAVDQGIAPVIEVAAGRWAGARVDRSVALRGREGAIVDVGVPVGRLSAGLWLVDGADGVRIEGFRFDCEAQVDAGVFSSARRDGLATGVQIAHNGFRGCVQGVTVAAERDGEAPVVDWWVHDNRFHSLITGPLGGGEGGGIGVLGYGVGAVDVAQNRFTGWVQQAGFATAGVALVGVEGGIVIANGFWEQGGAGHVPVVIEGGRGVVVEGNGWRSEGEVGQ